MGYKSKEGGYTFELIFSAIAIFHGPVRMAMGVEPSTPIFSSILLLMVTYFALVYTMKEKDPILWVYKNFKTNLNHPLIIATEFNIVLHAFLLHPSYKLNMAVSCAFALYYFIVAYYEQKTLRV